MRTRTIALILVALAACQPGQDQPRKRTASRPAVPSAGAVANAQAAPTVLQLAETDRLRVDLPWSGPGAPSAPRVDVTTPRGRLYAQLPVSLQLDAQGQGTATAVLEVRGTPIDAYHMVGTWRFVLVDGGGPPVASASIELQ